MLGPKKAKISSKAASLPESNAGGNGNRKALSNGFFVGLTTLTVSILSGCMVGPDFQGAAPPVVSQTFSQPWRSHTDTRLSAWWNVFQDPILNDLLSVAESQNPNLQEAFHRVMESRANLGLVGGARKPLVDSISQFEYLKQSQNARPFVGSNGDPFNLHTKGFAASWELDFFGRIARSIESADAELSWQQSDHDFIRLTLLGDVATSYFSVLWIQQQRMIADDTLASQEQTIQLISERSAAGMSNDLDLTQAKAFQKRTLATIPALERQLDVELNRLSMLLGGVPREEIKSRIGFGSLPMAPNMMGTGLPADLLRNRPDVRREEYAVAAASARIGVAESDLYPRFHLLGTIALSSKTISSLFETGSLEFSVGPSVRWNILHFGRIRDNIEIHKARFNQTIARYQQTVLNAIREVEDSLAQQNGFLTESDTLSETSSLDHEAVDLTLERYKAGKANFQRVLDVQQQLLSDRQTELNAQVQALIQTVNLYRSLGGGWSPVDVLPMYSEVMVDSLLPTIVPIEGEYEPIKSDSIPKSDPKPGYGEEGYQGNPNYPPKDDRVESLNPNFQSGGKFVATPPPIPDDNSGDLAAGEISFGNVSANNYPLQDIPVKNIPSQATPVLNNRVVPLEEIPVYEVPSFQQPANGQPSSSFEPTSSSVQPPHITQWESRPSNSVRSIESWPSIIALEDSTTIELQAFEAPMKDSNGGNPSGDYWTASQK